MGVHGLWQLLQAAGQPVTLESLEGKILAVDVSIWLHQTMKGMRDKEGNPVLNAHLQGLFSRICKLLFYRIRPIFVFDGGVPVLKKRTIAARRERKAEAERESNEISVKLLENLIKSQAVRQTMGGMEGSSRHVPKGRRGRGAAESDIFELPPLAESEQIGLAINAEEWDKDFERQEQWIKEGLAAVSDTNPDSEEFRSLPMEIQHEILNELRQQKKYHSLSTITNMPEDSTDFSSYQLKKLMKQSKLTNRIEEVRKNMASKTSVDIACNLAEEYHGEEVEARRIVSEDAAHYILIKGLTKKMQQEEAHKYELHNRVKLEKVEEERLRDDGATADGGARIKDKPHSEDATSFGSEVKGQSSDSDSDGKSALARRLNRKRQQRTKASGTVTNAKKSGKIPGKKAKQIVSEDENVSSDEQHHRHDVVDCSSEDEGFIEIRVDPSVVAEDDLFPASIFQTSCDGEEISSSDSKLCQQTDRKRADTSQPKDDLIRTDHKRADTSQPKDDLIRTDHKRADTSQQKDDGTRSKTNIIPDMLQTTETAHPNINLDDATGSKNWIDKNPNPVSVIDDIATKRKNVLNEILSQLEEKKKHLSDLQAGMPADMHVDTSIDGGFIKEDFPEELDEMSTITNEREADFVMTSAPIAIIPHSVEQGPGRSLISVTDETSSLSESDEDLKIAIELSLQTARSATVSLAELKDEISSADGIRRTNVEADKVLLRTPEVKEQCDEVMSSDCESDSNDFVETAAELSFTQSPKRTAKDNQSADNGGADLQKDAGNSSPNESLSCDAVSINVDARSSISEPTENQKGRSHLLLTKDVQPGKALSNETQFENSGIDFERTYHSVNEEELEDVRTRLESERSALMSERGRHNRLAASITDQTNAEAQELLRLFGIPFIISPMEAEAQCAHLNLTRQVQGTVTDDSDIWLFGGSHVYKNFFNQSKHVELYTLDNICNHFGLSRQQLINIALLCGSDYTEGIPGVGPVRALEIMAEFPGDGLKGLQAFRKWWDKAKTQIALAHENKVRAKLKDLKIIPGFPSQAVVDAYLNPQVDDSTERFTWETPDLDMLREFAKYKFGWSREKSDQSLLPMMKKLSNRESQSRIYSYFQPEHFIKNSKVKSQRLKNALAMVRSSKHATQDQDTADENSHNKSDVNDAMVDISGKEKMYKRRDVTESSAADSGSHNQGKVTGPSKNKKVAEKSSKKTGGTLKRKINVELTEIEIERDELGGTQKKVITEETEREKVHEKRKLETGEVMKTKQNRTRKEETGIKNKKQVSFTRIRNDDNDSSTNIKGHREESVRQEKEMKEEADFVGSQSQLEGDERPNAGLSTNINPDICRTERGGKTTTMRGRGRMLISLDHKQRSRVRNVGPKAGNLRGAQNLSSTSGSSDDDDDDDGGDSRDHNQRLKVNRSRLHTAKVKQGKTSKHKPSVGTFEGADGQVPEGQRNAQLATGKKPNKERIHAMSEVSMSAELTRLKQDDGASLDEQNIDMKKADVSVINKQNLVSTLTYLNRRSKEDQLLLQQLKDTKSLNAVERRLQENEKRQQDNEKRQQDNEKRQQENEKRLQENEKRLQENEKRSKQERKKLKGCTQDPEDGRSFEDILGSVDTSVGKGSCNKVWMTQTHKKVSGHDASQRDSSSQAKIFQERMLQQIGQFGTVLIGTSSKEELNANLRQPGLKTDSSSNRNSSMHINYPRNDDCHEKDRLTNNLNKDITNEDLPEQEDIIEKTFSMPKKAAKSHRSRAFDKPIDNMSDYSSDVLSDSGSCKLSKKNKFLKQMEHLGDSRSVKGHGLLPRQYTGGGQAFVGKGKGRGKNRNYATELCNQGGADIVASKNVTEQEILEYAFITADDLGSDFSDSEV